jgi:hypothetical protein
VELIMGAKSETWFCVRMWKRTLPESSVFDALGILVEIFLQDRVFPSFAGNINHSN